MRNPSGNTVQDLRLRIASDPESGLVTVTAENRPDLPPVRSRDQRAAINEFRSRAAEEHRRSESASSLMIPGERLDD